MAKLVYAESDKSDGNLSVRIDSEEVVAPKREAFLSRYGITARDCVYIETEHENKITHVSSQDKGRKISTEALITNEVGVPLFLLTADCLPIAFHDPVKEVVALAHCGWKPTDKKLALQVVQELASVYQSKPEDIKVFIGPGIHKESYVVPELSQNSRGEWGNFLTLLVTGETRVDLGGYNQKQLVDSGVQPDNIYLSPVDTATSMDYFSHYRSVRTGEPEGRFATVVGLV